LLLVAAGILLVLAVGGVAFLGAHNVSPSFTDLRPEVEPLLPPMVEIPEGAFMMGAVAEGTVFEQPVHEVYLSSYSIGRYEVTNEEYARFVEATGRDKPANPIFSDARNEIYFENYPRHPVVGITWTDAAAYCKWLSDRTGKNYQLPTEAQWEKAARGGLENKLFFWGDERLPDMARMNLSWSEGTVEVGASPPNGFGMYDVAGNANEMVYDWYDEEWYSKSPRLEPVGPGGLSNYLTLINPPERSRLKGRCKVVRGGSYRAPWDWVTTNPDDMLEITVNVGARDYLYQEPYEHFDLGFRVALTPVIP
jgi:formylglycine-generating enzyme required for sulfatase activity